ncbi:MAG: hypothetical protein JXM70_30115 [Pirellulales bacterium]|nr:hypothetical protein [Pirellulales bacterium]
MPKEYNKSGIHFQYPDNWQLDDTDTSSDCQTVSVFSPGGAFWTVSRHTRLADAKELAQAAVEAMRQEYAEIEVEAASETIADHELVGFNLSFYYVDLTNTAWIRSLRADRSTFTIFYQGEDHELKEIQAVMQAMTISFLQNLPVGNFLD